MKWYWIAMVVLWLLILLAGLIMSLRVRGWWFLPDKKLFKYLVASQIEVYDINNLVIKMNDSTGQLMLGYTIEYLPAPFAVFHISQLGSVSRWSKSHKYLMRIWKGQQRKEATYEKVFGIKINKE